MKAIENWLDRRTRNEWRLLMAALVTAYSLPIAWALETMPLPPSPLPEWFWPSLVMGVIQGAVVYGGIKVKMDWIFSRLATNEKKISDNDARQDEQDAKTNARIDRALERPKAGRVTD